MLLKILNSKMVAKMKENLEKCMELILKHEGGYVNHPRDPGGETNLGITKRVYQEWGGTKDMRDLTVDDVTPIYKKNYWDKMRCDDLPSGLDLCLFDFGVNAGTGRAVKKLQAIIGTAVDGGIGPNTLRALDMYILQNGIEKLIDQYQDVRLDYYKKLKHFDTFGRGWTRRTLETTEAAMEMV